MAAKHARHQMREDKNFKGTDPSEITAQSLYCAHSLWTRARKACRNLRVKFQVPDYDPPRPSSWSLADAVKRPMRASNSIVSLKNARRNVFLTCQTRAKLREPCHLMVSPVGLLGFTMASTYASVIGASYIVQGLTSSPHDRILTGGLLMKTRYAVYVTPTPKPCLISFAIAPPTWSRSATDTT